MTDLRALATPASRALREGAADDPGKVAVEIDDHRITYGELNQQADRLAQRLAAEFGEGERVMLRTHETHGLLVGFLGIQRAGMVSIPIDPTAPPARVRTIVTDVLPSLLLSDIDADDDLRLSIPTGRPLSFGDSAEPVAIDRPRGELVSIVYTSGSTGVPKGIMMSRAQVDAWSDFMGTFDALNLARYGVLSAGSSAAYIENVLRNVLTMRGTLVSYEIRRHGLGALARWIQDSEIVSFMTVPTVLRHFLGTLASAESFPHLRFVMLNGEAFSDQDVVRLRSHLEPDAFIVNCFGLTETGPIASLQVSGDTPLARGPQPVGRATADVELMIVDPAGEPVPDGEPGEIVVRTDALALGYWGRPDLTRAAFRDLEDGRREFRTSDSGRLSSDGILMHLGRLDHVVKISGNRVELGEVEAALNRIDTVAAAAAAPYPDDQGTRLAACVVPQAGAQLDVRLVRAHLARHLPGYMVPTRISISETLPLLPGGKVDRSRVAEQPGPDTAGDDEMSSDLERRLAEIWRPLLGVDRVGRHDDFFLLGGSSLDAARMFVELESELGIDRPVSLLAEAPTIASLAAMLTSEAYSWDELLAVRTEGAEPPLFVVHDGIGSVLYARGLAESLGSDHPIYGIRCEGLSGRQPGERSLTELASTYVNRIQRLYPSGPYRLYGVSLGGVIAMEMARQLIARGEQVPLVVLGDTDVPRPGLRPRSRAEVARHMDHLRRTPATEWVPYLTSVLGPKLRWLLGGEGSQMRREDRQLNAALKRGDHIPAPLRGRFVVHHYGRLLQDHEAQPPFPDRTVLLRSGRPGRSADRGWRALLGDSLEIVAVPGTHNDLGREASGAYVGPAITRALGAGIGGDMRSGRL